MPNWFYLPEKVWMAILDKIHWRDRPTLELVCQLFYALTRYHDLRLTHRLNPDNAERFFVRMLDKSKAKNVRFREIYLLDPSDVTLEIVRTNFSSASMTLSFTDENINERLCFIVEPGCFRNLTALRIDGCDPIDINEPYGDFLSLTVDRSVLPTVFPNLKHLALEKLEWCPSRMPAGLRSLYLQCITISEPMSEILAGCTQLQELTLTECKCLESLQLPFLPELKYLAFFKHYNPNMKHGIAWEMLRRGGSALPALQCLEVHSIDGDFNRMHALNHLTGLAVGITNTGNGLTFLNQCNPGLSRLCVNYFFGKTLNVRITQHVLGRFLHLQALKLRMQEANDDCNNMLDLVCTRLPQLQELYLYFAQKSAALSLRALARASDTLIRVGLEYRPSLDPLPNLEPILTSVLNECITVRLMGGPRRQKVMDLSLEHFEEDAVPQGWTHLGQQLTLSYSINVTFSKNKGTIQGYFLWNYDRSWYPHTDVVPKVTNQINV